MAGSWATVRRLAVLATDERGDYNERVAAALEACRRIVREELAGVEDHQRPAFVDRRIEGPLYLRRERDEKYTFIRWHGWYLDRGIPEGVGEEFELPMGACAVVWMTDEEKWKALGCCPSQPVARWVDVAVSTG